MRNILKSLSFSIILLCWLFIPYVWAQTPQYGGTLKLLGGDPRSFDNADWSYQHSADTGFFMEHLLVGDLQKGPRGSNIFNFLPASWIPDNALRGELAESWEVKKDQLKVVFHLRKGIQWMEKKGVMNARELTADDVVFSMTRWKNSRRATPLFLDFVDRWEATDKYTVVMHMKKWNAEWSYRTAWGYYDAVQAPEQSKTDKPNHWTNATGTGPMMITSFRRGHSVELTKNPHYWDTTIIDGKRYKFPFIDKLIAYNIGDRSTQLTAFRTGKIDMLPLVFGENFTKLKNDFPKLIWHQNAPMYTFMIALRMDRKPFDDIRVRRALNLAVNQQEIVDKLYDGDARLYSWPFPKYYTQVYTPFEKLPKTTQELYGYNPEKAKKLLAEAGYANGFTFTAQYTSENERVAEMAPLIIKYLKDVGVNMILEPIDGTAFFGLMVGKKHKEALFIASSYSNPYSMVRMHFLPRQMWNPFMMNDPEMEKKFIKIIEDPNMTEAKGYEEMRKMAIQAADQAPSIMLPMQNSYFIRWPWVKNVYDERSVGAARGGPIYARMWIDQDMKKKMGFGD
jgi:peptide/nickel transport system substrate-binding protein